LFSSVSFSSFLFSSVSFSSFTFSSVSFSSFTFSSVSFSSVSFSSFTLSSFTFSFAGMFLILLDERRNLKTPNHGTSCFDAALTKTFHVEDEMIYFDLTF
jgi:uncharacterized protein YjbI with pentapeptide repeats